MKEVSDLPCLVPNRLIPQHNFATLQYQGLNVLLTRIHTMGASIHCRKLDDTCKFLEALFLFWCFVLGQIFKGSNHSCEGTRFVVLDSGVQVYGLGFRFWGSGSCALDWSWHPFVGTGTRMGPRNYPFTRSGTEIKTIAEYMFRLFRWAS